MAIIDARMIALTLATCFALLAPGAAFADDSSRSEITVDPTGQDEGYSAVLYDNTNGLPTSEANAIAETSEGFIWIGGYGGLIRYDGETFTRIDSTTGIASVVSLFADSKSRLWIGSNDGGVTVMENGEFRTFNKSDGLESSSVRAIAEDPDGTIYAATTHGIATIDQNMQLNMMTDLLVSGMYVRDLRAGADGILYGVSKDGAIFTIKDGRLEGFYGKDQLGIPDAMSILPDPEAPGSVFVGTNTSSVYYGNLGNAAEGLETIGTAPLSSVKDIQKFGNEVWICADNGIGKIEGGEFVALDNVPLDNSVDHVMADYEGNLWFTSSRQGVMKIVPNQFSDIFERYDLPEDVVNSTCLLDDTLFMGTDGGLTALGPDGVKSTISIEGAWTASGQDLGATDLVAMLENHRIRSITRDSHDRLWFATYGEYGLMRFDGSSVLCFTNGDGLPSDRTRAICEKDDGTIMVACTGGMALIDGDRVTRVYDTDDGISNTEILTVAQASNGDMILGSDGDGIYVINDSATTHIGSDSGLSSEVVMRVKRDDSRDLFWLVTSNSIAYMDEDYRVTTVKNFPYSNNFDLYENSKGEVWVLSSNGIYVVQSDELIANGDISPIFYGTDNGLPCIATANSYSYLAEDGNLYIAGSTGVAKVNIETPFETVDNVKMAVPYVEVDGKSVYADKSGKITIPSNTEKLTIHGFVYTYSLMNPLVTYRLDGFEQHRTTVRRSELTPIDYTNLSGGTYHFVMQLSDAMGNGNKELSVAIEKQEAIHEMLWFRILCVIAGLALIAIAVQFYIRRRTRAFERKEAENREFIREMTEAFARVIDMKDAYTNGHSSRVAQYTAMLTRELGYDDETVDRYYNIALLHDIGKIGVPAAVLNKPGKLDDEEFTIIKSHAERGYATLKDISIMPELSIGAWAHHERPDGKGYPRGLTQDEIPRVAQIIAVADTFDAMYSDRPYRKRMNFEKAVSIIKDVSGTQLTPDVVDAFLHLVDKGEFRLPDDDGGGTTEDINNIHKKFDEE